MVFFVVVACIYSFVTEDGVTGSARWLDLLLVQQLLHAWCMAHVSQRLCFCVVVCVGHAGGDDSCHCRVERTTLDSCTGRQNVAVCIRCAHVAAIDVLVAILVVAVWVSSWYSQRPHNALVAFVNKAESWLQGWSPRPSSLHLRGSSCERFGISRWLRWLRPSQLATALIAFIAIGNVVVACCGLLQLRIALMLTPRSQLLFLLVY